MSKEKAVHLYEEKCNNQGCLMKIVEYNSNNDMVVEFQDKYGYKTHAQYCNFKTGSIKNPYHNSVYGIGMIGVKYLTCVNGQQTKEYRTWLQMLRRCFSQREKKRLTYYQEAICCEEWLLYENFYEWLHNQDNFDKWYSGERWAVDKDIIIKNNKLYSPTTCCLVPQNINCLLLKRDALRGDLPLGVRRNGNKFRAACGNPFTGKQERFGVYKTPEEAFYAYKSRRENYIKQVAKIEYESGNITKQCYDALMNYVIEIND